MTLSTKTLHLEGFIRSHGVTTVIGKSTNEFICVIGEYVQNSESFSQEEMIPANLQSIRDWLNY